MSYRVGMDIVEVSDVEGSIARFGDRYLRRVFTQREISACDDGSDVRCLATCFAAKEAALKTFGTDVGAVDLRSVEILLDPEPVVTLSGGGARLAVCERISHFSVSVVASAGYAAAVVLAESTAKPLDDHTGS
jgi:holo-[acyl-carrier protein] synthase